MRRLIEWFARNAVAANLLMVVIMVSGALGVGRLVIEFFPDMSIDTISISVPYLGAAPQEVEEGICRRVEEALLDLEDVRHIRCTAAEGAGTVLVELETGTDLGRALDDVKTRIDAIETFPEETERPIVREVLVRWPVLTVAVAGDIGERTLKSIAEDVRDGLIELPDVSHVTLQSVRPYEISIEVSEQNLLRFGLTFDEVVAAVRSSSLDLPGGSIRADDGEILLRAKGQAYVGSEFEQLVLRTRSDGSRLLLGDVATVVDGFAERDLVARFDGRPTALVQVSRVGDQSALAIARDVREYLEQAQLRLPPGIELVAWQDESVLLRDRLRLLVNNGRTGLILVFCVLALFVRFRLAAWVSVGIAVSFLGALAVLPALGVTINMISLFAFVMVLGIVVDDAIVVGENIYRHHEEGKDSHRAAIEGTQEVAIPVTFSILTTIAAFAPMLLIDTQMGKVMTAVPLVVIACLVFSLIESMLILPTHLSHMARPRQERRAGVAYWWRRVQSITSGGLVRLVDRYYRPSLERLLQWRYTVVATAVALLVVTVSALLSGWIPFLFFPAIEADNVVAYVTLPQGSSSNQTAAVVERIAAAAEALEYELDQRGLEGVVRHRMTTIGEQPFRDRQDRAGTLVGSLVTLSRPNIGEVNLELKPAESRSISGPQIAARWRELTGPIPEATELLFSADMVTFGDPIFVQLQSRDLAQLEAAADTLKTRLTGYPGVFDVTDSVRAGKREILLDVLPAAEALGLSLQELARQVRAAFYGVEAQRIQRGSDDVRVMVRYPLAQRRDLAALEEMRIRTPSGAEIAFRDAARIEIGRGYESIARVDRQRTVSVTAKIDPSITNANEITADLSDNVLPALLIDNPQVSYTFEGEQQEQRDSLIALGRGFLLCLVVIYGLLAIPFGSYVQPLIVMSAIPFGLIGAIWGHVLLGMDVTSVSLFGVIALTGVVVNDSLVMVDFINRRVRGGEAIDIAIREAGAVRFRPILMTSLTTFAGLTPLLLERSLQAQFLIPMALSLAFGVLFATAITLILVPLLYRILEDVHGLWSRRVRTAIVRLPAS